MARISWNSQHRWVRTIAGKLHLWRFATAQDTFVASASTPHHQAKFLARTAGFPGPNASRPKVLRVDDPISSDQNMPKDGHHRLQIENPHTFKESSPHHSPPNLLWNAKTKMFWWSSHDHGFKLRIRSSSEVFPRSSGENSKPTADSTCLKSMPCPLGFAVLHIDFFSQVAEISWYSWFHNMSVCLGMIPVEGHSAHLCPTFGCLTKRHLNPKAAPLSLHGFHPLARSGPPQAQNLLRWSTGSMSKGGAKKPRILPSKMLKDLLKSVTAGATSETLGPPKTAAARAQQRRREPIRPGFSLTQWIKSCFFRFHPYVASLHQNHSKWLKMMDFYGKFHHFCRLSASPDSANSQARLVGPPHWAPHRLQLGQWLHPKLNEFPRL